MFKFPGQPKATDIDLEDAATLGLRLPMDASQLPRLLNLRIEKASQCGCQRCGDLLDNLHNKTRLMEKAHKVEAPALTFWLHIDSDVHAAHLESEKKVQMTAQELTSHDEFIDVLVSAEKDWQQSQRNNCTSSNSHDTDLFWTMHYADVKKHVAELRNFESENLQKLRDAVLVKADSENSASALPG